MLPKLIICAQHLIGNTHTLTNDYDVCISITGDNKSLPWYGMRLFWCDKIRVDLQFANQWRNHDVCRGLPSVPEMTMMLILHHTLVNGKPWSMHMWRCLTCCIVLHFRNIGCSLVNFCVFETSLCSSGLHLYVARFLWNQAYHDIFYMFRIKLGRLMSLFAIRQKSIIMCVSTLP